MQGTVRITNDVWEELYKRYLPGEARQVLGFIIRKTIGWQKKWAVMSLKEIGESTNIRRQNVHRNIHLLQSLQIIVIKQGYKKMLSYSFNMNYGKWKLYSRRGRVIKEGYKAVIKEGDDLIITDNKRHSTTYVRRKRKTSPKKAQSWITGFAEMWMFYLGGTFPFGMAGKFLKPLIDRHGEALVLKRFKSYLAKLQMEKKLEMASFPYFATKFGLWKEDMSYNTVKKDWEADDGSSSGAQKLKSVMQERTTRRNNAQQRDIQAQYDKDRESKKKLILDQIKILSDKKWVS